MSQKRSPWQTEGQWPQAATEPLDRDLTADVCVIGAGMAGLLCARELSLRGHSVIVLEREAIAAGATGATTAHLTAVLDTRYQALTRMHGEDSARLAALSHQRAIAYLERLSNAYGIECDFRRLSGFLCAGNAEQAETLHHERDAARAAGLRCELVRLAPLPMTDGIALHVPHQGAFDPLAFLGGVVLALQARGVRIFAPVTVQEFDPVSATDQIGLRTSDGHSIRANYVVVATNTPINDVAVMHTKQAAYRSYGLTFASRDVIPCLCWDMEDPYHFVRSGIDATTRRPVLIVGGADHRVGQDLDGEHHWYQLEGWTRDRFPSAGEVVSRWSGQVFEPSDGLAYIGRNPGQERVFIVTGESGNGMTYSAISAELIADLVDGIPNAFEKIYDPSRKPSSLAAIGRFVRENLNVAEQYTDWLGPADVTRVEEIPRGEGAVLRRGLTRVAVYVDPGGMPHEFSATCPHLGGVVAWNSAEKSWDCPCHGSRFDCHGKVVSGPAVTDLRPTAPSEPSIEKAG